MVLVTPHLVLRDYTSAPVVDRRTSSPSVFVSEKVGMKRAGCLPDDIMIRGEWRRLLARRYGARQRPDLRPEEHIEKFSGGIAKQRCRFANGMSGWSQGDSNP
jgi:hypothetical protein